MRYVLGSRASIGVLGSGRGGAAAWYLAGGVSAANCVAAYQPIGAASLAASYTNLANPGTYDATVLSVAPTWNSTNGWIRTGGSGALDSGIAPTSSAWTMIFRYSNVSIAANSYRYIGRSVSGKTLAFAIGEGPSSWGYYNNGLLKISGTLSSGVLAIAGQTGYLDGASQGTIPTAWTGAAAGTLYLLSCYGLTAFAPEQIYMQALAIYNTTLTAPQVAALSAAMAAL